MLKKVILYLISIYCSTTTFNNCFANDTIKTSKYLPIEKLGRKLDPYHWIVENKHFQIGYLPGSGFFNFIDNSTNINNVIFQHSKFEVDEALEIIDSAKHTSGTFSIEHSFVKHLPIANTSGDIFIRSSQVLALSVQNSNGLNLHLYDDSALSVLIFQNNRNMGFQLYGCAFKDSGQIHAINTTFDHFLFNYDKRSGCRINFHRDTINSFIGSENTMDFFDPDSSNNRYFHENIFIFSECYINTNFTFDRPLPGSVIIFDKCTFGPNASLSDLAVNKVVIRNCINIQESLSIGFREKEKQVNLEIINSTVEKLTFDFEPNIKLVFESGYTKDIITNTYKRLLEKFKNEGKDLSYKYVDLQYRKYNDGKLFHFLNKIWWNHGYTPSLVFLWTFVLLIIFFITNILTWNKIYEVYPIVEGQKADAHNKRNKKLRFYSIVFLYTAFIFFSLRVNFDKLKFKKLSFIYLLLIEYISGLLCLLFIIRFVIKL